MRVPNYSFVSYALARGRWVFRLILWQRGAEPDFHAVVARQRIPSMYNTAPGIVPAFILSWRFLT